MDIQPANKITNMNKNIIIIIVLIAIIGGIFIYKNSKSTESSSLPPVTTDDTTKVTLPGMPILPPPPTDENTPVSPTTQSTVKEFTVIGKNYSFSPAKITVKKGDTVKITFKDDDGFHDLKIDGYNVATQRVNTGGESMVRFVADKAGQFEYYCSVDSHRDKGMKGIFMVTE